MDNRFILLIGVFLFMAISCAVPGIELQTTKIPETTLPQSTSLEASTPEMAMPEVTIKIGVYKNDLFSFTIPDGWKEEPIHGKIFDLGVEELLTIRSNTNPAGFFTIASVPLAVGETLQSRLDQAYKKGPQIENVVTNSIERDTFSGIELTYDHPWGEPWWSFRDIWLEKDGVVYVLSFQAYRGPFENHTQTFESILDSFSFKQTKPQNTAPPETATEVAPTVFPC